jgi:hypothetical protein
LVCTQSYQCLWPKNGWTPKCLAAILNTPLASAFIAAIERKHVRKSTLEKLPIPQLTPGDKAVLERLVDEYSGLLNEGADARLPLFGGNSWEERAKKILLQMDAIILKGYGLPPWLERKLLDFFRDERRPVSFEFGNYFPADFRPNISLWRFISPSFQASRPQEIIPHLPELHDEELTAALEDSS